MNRDRRFSEHTQTQKENENTGVSTQTTYTNKLFRTMMSTKIRTSNSPLPPFKKRKVLFPLSDDGGDDTPSPQQLQQTPSIRKRNDMEGHQRCLPIHSVVDELQYEAAAALSTMISISSPASLVTSGQMSQQQRVESRSPSSSWGSQDEVLPGFHTIVNYPENIKSNKSTALSQHRNSNKATKFACCVMCNIMCSVGKSSVKVIEDGEVAKDMQHHVDHGHMNGVVSDSENSTTSSGNIQHLQPALSKVSFIPKQNKGLCTGCDSVIWVIAKSGQKIKWCKGCKNFKPLAGFGAKERATKCSKCRNRQRQKYASQKKEAIAKKGGELKFRQIPSTVAAEIHI